MVRSYGEVMYINMMMSPNSFCQTIYKTNITLSQLIDQNNNFAQDEKKNQIFTGL